MENYSVPIPNFCQHVSDQQKHTTAGNNIKLILTLPLCLTVYDENATVWKLLIYISYKLCLFQHFLYTSAYSATIQQQHNTINLHLEHRMAEI